MEPFDKDQIMKLTGINEPQLDAMMDTGFGEDSMQFLAQWANVTSLSLKANRAIISQCLTQDDENHILCRFCGDGIPNWKLENSREHTSECPINHVSKALIATKELKNGIEGMEKYEGNNPMPRGSF